MAILPSDPQLRQKVLLGVLLVGGLGYLAHTYLLTPRAAEIAALETRLETIQTQNETARALAGGAGVADVERQLGVYQAQLATVEGLIPLSEELPDLLDAISAEAQRTGVDLSLIQPTDATQEEFYTRRTYSIAVLGTYHDVGEFLARIASLPRVITPINLSLTPVAQPGRDGQPRLQASFSIETYVLPDPNAAPAPVNAE